MFKLPDFSSIDFPKIDLSTFDLAQFDLARFNLPKIDLPTIDEKFTAAVRDAAYIVVGLGVVAVERTQARRQQLIAGISERFGARKTHVDTLLGVVEARLARIDEQAREATKAAREQVLGLVRPAA
jgi:hypothetical protein